jgi:hypothetical protein
MRRISITVVIAAGLAMLGWVGFGEPGIAIALVLSLLIVSIRHDNNLGTCFPLAVMFVLVLAVLLLLIAMLGMMGARS